MNPELQRLLDAAKARGPMTAEEEFEQRVSFVYGCMDFDSNVTKEQVREALRKQMGYTTKEKPNDR